MRELARLRELITRHADDGPGLTATALPGVLLRRATAPNDPLGDVAEPSDIAGAGFSVGYGSPSLSSAANTGAHSACRPAATRA